jgi:SAM-dependent methyltransferase
MPYSKQYAQQGCPDRGSSGRRMSAIYSIPYRLWNGLPFSFRQWIVRKRFLAAPLQMIRKRLMPYGRHDEIYDKRYFELIDSLAGRSAEVIAESVRTEFTPRSVLDVGCGTGAILAILQSWGICSHGLEQSEAALEVCQTRGLDVRKFDLERDELAKEDADVVVSLEVAEHLPEAIVDRYVEILCQGNVVVMTAAQPGQGGTDHVNEQPHSYWISKFADRGFAYHEKLTEKLRSDWQNQGVATFYAQNLMVFYDDSAEQSHFHRSNQ